jgi:hypothetical protein
MEEKQLNAEVLSDLYKNAQIGLQSISYITKTNEDVAMKQELLNQYEGYEKMAGKIATLMMEFSVIPKEANPLKKAMLWSSIKMNTITDNSVSHIADMMIKGTVMGINELLQIINQKETMLDDSICVLAKELLSLEESYQEDLKKYL